MSDDRSSQEWNPYEPPSDTQSGTPLSAVLIHSVGFPPGKADCAYFTYREFAQLFETKLHEACALLDIPTLRPDESAKADEATATISSSVTHLVDYRLTSWNWLKKYVVPNADYEHRLAGFVIEGNIDSPQHETIPFRLYRTFERNLGGTAGEKRYLRTALQSEAARVIGMVARRNLRLNPDTSSALFWPVLLCVPLAAAIVGSAFIYAVQQASPDIRMIRTVLVFIAVGLLTTAALPGRIYRDARAAFFYQITAAKSALVLRAFPMVLGLLAAAFAIASFIYGDG